MPGFGTNDGGVVLDLSSMRGTRVDVRSKSAHAQGGCRWGEVLESDRRLIIRYGTMMAMIIVGAVNWYSPITGRLK